MSNVRSIVRPAATYLDLTFVHSFSCNGSLTLFIQCGDKREFLDEICARHMIYARACQDSWHGVMLQRKSNPRPLWCCWHMSHLIRHIQWNLCHIFSCAIVWITSVCCVLCFCCVLGFQVVEACIIHTGCPHSSKMLIVFPFLKQFCVLWACVNTKCCCHNHLLCFVFCEGSNTLAKLCCVAQPLHIPLNPEPVSVSFVFPFWPATSLCVSVLCFVFCVA